MDEGVMNSGGEREADRPDIAEMKKKINLFCIQSASYFMLINFNYFIFYFMMQNVCSGSKSYTVSAAVCVACP